MNLLNEREKTHGKFGEVARVSRELKDSFGIVQLTLPPIHREALDMICTKMARIVCGDHNEHDHWRDIVGYAQLVLNNLDKNTASRANVTIMEMDPDEESSNSDYYIPRSGLPR